jgi:hypothetical protein
MFMLVCSKGDTDIGMDIFRFFCTQMGTDIDKFLNVYTCMGTEKDLGYGLVICICLCTYMEL